MVYKESAHNSDAANRPPVSRQPELIPAIAKTGAAKWSYFSLIFSAFYFFNLIAGYQHYSKTELMLAGVIYLVFIGLFLQTTQKDSRAAAWPVLMIVVLAAAGTSVHPGTNALFGYPAFFSGYYFSRKKASVLLLVNLVAQVAAAYAFDVVSPYFLGPSFAVTLSLFVYGVFSQKEYFHVCQQIKKNQQIEQLAAIAERERIARDMHDLLGHSLSSLALKSELACKLIDKGQTDVAQKEMAEIADLARETLSEVRYAVTGLKHKGITGALAKLTDELKKMNFKVKSHLETDELPAKIESALILLAKEWVTNILRHSQGTEVSIVMVTNIGVNGVKQVSLKIGDNGQVAQITPGNGIEGMQTRVEELGGNLTIDLTSGTKLSVDLPLAESELA